jgi:hypothetical protein
MATIDNPEDTTIDNPEDTNKLGLSTFTTLCKSN